MWFFVKRWILSYVVFESLPEVFSNYFSLEKASNLGWPLVSNNNEKKRITVGKSSIGAIQKSCTSSNNIASIGRVILKITHRVPTPGLFQKMSKKCNSPGIFPGLFETPAALRDGP